MRWPAKKTCAPVWSAKSPATGRKPASLRAQRDTVTTAAQADAIEHEIKFAEAEIERLENEEYASLERTEAQETVLAAARAQVERWPAPWTRPANAWRSGSRN